MFQFLPNYRQPKALVDNQILQPGWVVHSDTAGKTLCTSFLYVYMAQVYGYMSP